MRIPKPISVAESPSAYRIRGGTWEYTVSRVGGLIEGLVVRGEAWLAGSVPDLWASDAVDPRGRTYCARFGPAAGARLVSADDRRVLIESEGGFARIDGDALPLAWRLRYTFDEDGTVRIDAEVAARGLVGLRWLSLGRGEVERSACRFVAHEGDLAQGIGTCRPACHALEGGSFEAGGAFIPWVHFGNDRGGIDLVFPHSEHAQSGWTDTSPYPTGDPLGRAHDRIVIQAGSGRPSWEVFAIRNLYEPVDEGWRWSDTFYLSAVPGKEPDPRANDLRVWWLGPHQYRSGWRVPDEDAVARWAAAGANLVIGGANWRSGDYSHPERPEETEAFLATCHRYGMKVIPYLTFTDLEFGAPAFATHGREWRIEPVSEFNYRSHLMCYGAEGWQEHWEKEVAAAWERFPFDGLYIDFWSGRLGCRNAAHGCSGPYGRFTLAGLRRMARYAAGLVAGRDGLLVANCNILPLAMVNNCFDVRLLGEWNNPEEVEPLPLRLFHNAHRLGCTNLMLTGKVPQISERSLALAETTQGPLVLSGARTDAEREILSRRARLLASFGVERAAARNAFELPELPELHSVRPSLYRRDDNGESLLTLANASGEAAVVSLSVLRVLCGQPAGRWLVLCVETEQVLGGRALAACDLDEITLDVPAGSIRTLWLRPDPERPCVLYALTGRERPEAAWDPEERVLSFTLAHPALAQAEVLVAGMPLSVTVGAEGTASLLPRGGCAQVTVPCNTPVAMRFPAPRVPQLRMRFSRWGAIPDTAAPAGYGLRCYRPGDEAAWAAVLNSVGDLGHWDVPRVIHLLQSERHACPEGSFFATWEGLPVGTACTVMGAGSEPAELGWVAVMPEHQGRHLAAHLCLAVLRYLRDHGAQEAFLFTDDHRLAAIKTYLRLGFEPQVTDPSHPARWQRLLAELGG